MYYVFFKDNFFKNLPKKDSKYPDLNQEKLLAIPFTVLSFKQPDTGNHRLTQCETAVVGRHMGMGQHFKLLYLEKIG